MPLLLHQFLRPEGELGLWRIEEPYEFFEDQLDLHPQEWKQVEQLQGHRRTEWLAGRWLLHIMSGRKKRGACLKDEFGKPYLQNSFYQISMSHSREMAAIIASPRAVGVDIQKLVEKIERIAHKYMRDAEAASLKADTRLEHLHVYWGAKEALYKAYGRRQLDFRAHIFIDPFEYDLKVGKCTGRIIKDDYKNKFEIFYKRIEDYILVYAFEAIGDQRIAM